MVETKSKETEKLKLGMSELCTEPDGTCFSCFPSRFAMNSL